MFEKDSSVEEIDKRKFCLAIFGLQVVRFRSQKGSNRVIES